MVQENLPPADKNGIVRALPPELSEENMKRLSKFGSFMVIYDFIQDHWVRPRIHKANAKRHHQIMHEAIAPVSEARVFDIACGTGAAIPHFDKSNEYTGLDLSYSMLRQAVKKAGNKGFRKYQLIEGNAEELLFPSECFDSVLIDTSLHMIPGYQMAIGEAARVLKKDGKLICSCPTIGISEEFDINWAKIAAKRHLHSLKESDLEAVCSASGLSYSRIETNGGALYFRAGKK